MVGCFLAPIVVWMWCYVIYVVDVLAARWCFIVSFAVDVWCGGVSGFRIALLDLVVGFDGIMWFGDVLVFWFLVVVMV